MKRIVKIKIMKYINFPETKDYLEFVKFELPKLHYMLKSNNSIKFKMSIVLKNTELTSSLNIGDIIPDTDRCVIDIKVLELSLLCNYKYRALTNGQYTHAFLYNTGQANVIDLSKNDIITSIFNLYIFKYNFVTITKNYLIQVYEPGVKGLPEEYEYNIKERILYPTKYTGSNNPIALNMFEEYCQNVQIQHDKWNKS